ncbi:hypothetical protein ARTHRO9V_160437 [Arthrobacter sp. 9V]|nr:hypothetical protein ARTHRO9V_160437 [Arthrobacter sp. 9V]
MNLRPLDPQSSALPSCATARWFHRSPPKFSSEESHLSSPAEPPPKAYTKLEVGDAITAKVGCDARLT